MVDILFATTQVLILGENSQRNESLREPERETRVNGKEVVVARVGSTEQTGEEWSCKSWQVAREPCMLVTILSII